MPPSVLITTSLEMVSRGDFRPAYSSDPNLAIWQSHAITVPYYRFLYREVGYDWAWRDRLEWSDEELAAKLAEPTRSVYVLYCSGTPAGYIELEHQNDGAEIAYFGLMKPFLGRGFGKHLLSFGISRAWDWNPKRVWVHTCNLDGPHALTTYQKCGFQIFDVHEEPMPTKYIS